MENTEVCDLGVEGAEGEDTEGVEYAEYKEKIEHVSMIGPKDQFYMKAQGIPRINSDNKNSKKQFYSAGVLPFCVRNKTVYFLIGKDYEGKWSDFGGRSEIQDMCRWNFTAAREFYEETIGSIMDIQSMLIRLNNFKLSYKIKSKTMSGSLYVMYLVKIPYKESFCSNFHSTLNLLKYIKYSSKSKMVEYKFFEKTDIQWISLDTIKISLGGDENSESVNYPLRHIFQKTFEDNYTDITNFCNSFESVDSFDKIVDDSVLEHQPGITITDHKKYYNSNFFSKGLKNSSSKWR